MNSKEIFKNLLGQTSDFPLLLEIEKAEGVYLYEQSGKSYIDIISGISVSTLGHKHPNIIQALHEQINNHAHLMVYGEFVQKPQNDLAIALQKTLPKQLNNYFLVNSGSEAVEGALKLAKRFTGRKKIISCYGAYHGSTHGALSVGGDEKLKANFRPLLPDIYHIEYNNLNQLDLIDQETAAIIIETIQGEAGVRVPTSNYMKALRKKCSENGVLLILDEIQAGIGRTGKFWAFEHYDIIPDILVTAKGLGGGMPIGAFIAPNEIMSVLKNNPILGHITTFGGHPVSCAAAAATINTLLDQNLIEQVESKSELFKEHLKHPLIKEIRNKGLLMAVEFEDFDILKKIIDQAIVNGVITDWFLFCDNSLRIAPPLTITEEEIKKSCQIIIQSINEVINHK